MLMPNYVAANQCLSHYHYSILTRLANRHAISYSSVNVSLSLLSYYIRLTKDFLEGLRIISLVSLRALNCAL